MAVIENHGPLLSGELGISEKRRVALHSILAAIFLSILKLSVGLLTGSLGILSEAAHSGLDVVAAIMTYVSVHVSDKPADADHQYGHQKIENFSAFLQTGLLLATCAWIVMEAVRRLFFAPVRVELSRWAFAVMLIAIVVDFFRSRELLATARKYNSQALEADALHFHTDIWSSSVVIVGLAMLWLGQQLQLPQLRMGDPLAALAVAGFVISISAKLGRRTIDALLDAAPQGLRARIIEAVRAVKGVVACDRVRLRRAGSKFFVDVNITVERTTPFDHLPAIVSAVRARIGEILPDADIMIHSEPQAPGDENLFEKVQWIARRSNLSVHDLLVHEMDRQLTLDLHLEVDESFTLEQAHERVNYLEAQIFEEIPEIDVINTHIEAEGTHIETDEMASDLREQMVKKLREVATQIPEILDCHDVAIREIGHKIYVSCHCLMDGGLPITLVHDKTVELEALFRQTFPAIYKVTIHTEPESERGIPATARPRRPGVQDGR
jgi:cation diffusion facilitator family transporter